MSLLYREPSSIEELWALLMSRDAGAVPLAGGTDLFPLSRRPQRPAMLVGLRRLSEMHGIMAVPGGVWIGAMTTLGGVERSGLVQARTPVLADTMSKVGSVRIRNQATLGGNLARAEPAWDPPTTLITLDAVAVLAVPEGGHREVPVERLVTAGWRDTPKVILGVRVPTSPPGTRTAHLKIRARSAAGGVLVAVAAAVRLDDDGRIARARLALGAVGPNASRALRAERSLVGRPPTSEAFEQAATLAAEDIDPTDDINGSAGYKREMARVWVRRILTETVA